MTAQDLKELAEIMGEKPVDGVTLGQEVVRWYRLHERLLERHADVVEERDRLRKRVVYLQKNRRPSRSREAELLRALRAKEAALDFAVKRNEVLRKKVSA